jgi:hypothetical protein
MPRACTQVTTKGTYCNAHNDEQRHLSATLRGLENDGCRSHNAKRLKALAEGEDVAQAIERNVTTDLGARSRLARQQRRVQGDEKRKKKTAAKAAAKAKEDRVRPAIADVTNTV